MLKGVDTLIAGPLSPRGDSHDVTRASLIELLMTTDDVPRNEVYNFSVELWSPIATDVYNKGLLTEENKKILQDMHTICNWVNTEARDADGGTHHGNAYIIGGIAAHFLGNSNAAIESLKIACTMAKESSGWVGAAETLIRVYVDIAQYDEAMALVHEVLKHHPQNQYANNLLEANRIDEANAAQTQPTAQPTMEFGNVTAANITEIIQKAALDFQTKVMALMTGPLSSQEKTAEVQRMQAEYEANMKVLMSKLSA